MGRRRELPQVLVEQLADAAARCADVRARAIHEAIAEMNSTLIAFGVRLGTDVAAEALTRAAVVYAADDPSPAQWWYPDALAVLVLAGAREGEARTRRKARPRWSGPMG
jgi:hypothetical protein